MNINQIHVELPKIVGDGTEFFLQATPPASVACAAHVHKAVELLYVKNGSYTVLLDGVEYEIKKGDLVLFCSPLRGFAIADSRARGQKIRITGGNQAQNYGALGRDLAQRLPCRRKNAA